MERMSFEQFTNAVAEKIREYLPESFANASVELQTVTKNNDLKLTGLTIRCADNNICPTIYLEQFYEKYKTGADMKDILENIADVRVINEVRDIVDVGRLTDFEAVKKSIVPRLVNVEWNSAFLKERPHKVIADLAVTYHILIDSDERGSASVPVTNTLMEMWDVETDALHEIAVENMKNLLPSTFRSMSSVLMEMMGVDSDSEEAKQLFLGMPNQEDVLFVLSNKQQMNGAAALLDQEMMQSIQDIFGEDFIIIPSSAHEVLITIAGVDKNNLDEMVQEVNADHVAREDRLSNHVYGYSVEKGIYSI